MKNELLTIGPFTIYGYGLMIAIGIVAGCLTAEYRARKQGLDSEQIFPMILWCLVGGFLCAKLLFWITSAYLKNIRPLILQYKNPVSIPPIIPPNTTKPELKVSIINPGS